MGIWGARRAVCVRELGIACLILVILSCSVLWTGIYVVSALQPQWGASFVGRLVPLSCFPFLGVLIAALFTGVLAIVTGHIAIAMGRRVPGSGGVTGRALFGVLLGYSNVALIVFLALFLSGKHPHIFDMSICSKNLAQIETALREYAGKNRGMFPPLSSEPGVLMFSTEAIPQKEEIGPFLTCPTIRFAKERTTGSASPFDDQSYYYLGYALLNDDAVEAFARAYRTRIAEGKGVEGGMFDDDLIVEDAEGKHVLHRLANGVDKILHASRDRLSISPNAGKGPGHQDPGVETDDVPILIERGIHHKNVDYFEGPVIRGAWVLYLNLGVQFVEEGTWPLTEKTQRILAELAECSPG